MPLGANKIDAEEILSTGIVNNSSTVGNPKAEKIARYALLGMTAVTGLVDAVSFLSLGRVFTANMTGNVVILVFATARIPGLSIARSLTALLSFLVGAIFGGRIMPERAPTHKFDSRRKRSCWRWSFSLWRRFATSDTEAICYITRPHAALWLATAISALCSAALFRSVRTSDRP